MSQTSVATIVGSNKGGIGKSLLAQCLVLAHDQAGVTLRLAEIDYACKLRTVLGDRVDLSLDPGVTAQGNNIGRRAIEGHFNRLYEEIWMGGHSLTDLGANVTTPILDWFEANDIGTLAEADGIRFRFVAVASPDPQSLIATADAIVHARRVLGGAAEIVTILNDTTGGEGFAPYNDAPGMMDLVRRTREVGGRIVNVPFCHSLVMEYAQARNYDVLTMVNDVERVMAEMASSVSLSRIERHSHVRKMSAWAKSVEAALHDLFLDAAPKRPVAAAPASTPARGGADAPVVRTPQTPTPVRADDAPKNGQSAPVPRRVRAGSAPVAPARPDATKVNVKPREPAIDLTRMDDEIATATEGLRRAS